LFEFRLELDLFFSTGDWMPYPSCSGIDRQLVKFVDSAFDGSRRAFQNLGDVLGPTVSQSRHFEGDEAPSIPFRLCFPKLAHPFLNVRFVPLLKYKSHPWAPCRCNIPPFQETSAPRMLPQYSEISDKN
jgi:hypothetical protein